jgi:hypothetical protein
MARASSVSCCSDRAPGATRGRTPTTHRGIPEELRRFGREAARIAAIETDILYDTGAVVNALPFRAGAYEERNGLMHELRREGRDL